MSADNRDLDDARARLRDLRAQAEAERQDGVTRVPHNRHPGSARAERQIRNRRNRRRVSQKIRSG